MAALAICPRNLFPTCCGLRAMHDRFVSMKRLHLEDVRKAIGQIWGPDLLPNGGRRLLGYYIHVSGLNQSKQFLHGTEFENL